MNAKERKQNLRAVYNELSKSYHYKEGVVKINSNNTLTHELAKFLTCWEINKNGQSFLTETIWRNGTRSDIVILDTAEIIEIIHTENLDGHKNKLYPFPIIYLKAEEICEQTLKKENIK